MHLERHLRLQLSVANELIDLQHRQLDEISSGSLKRSIDRSAFRKASHIRIARLDVWNRTDPTKIGLHCLIATHSLKGLLDEPPHSVVTVEICFDVLLRRFLVDIELRSQSKRTDAVDN